MLSWRKDIFASNAGQLIDSLITHLRSASSLSAAGALQALGFLRPQYPDMKQKLDAAVLAVAPLLRRQDREEVLQPLANYLRLVDAERSRDR